MRKHYYLFFLTFLLLLYSCEQEVLEPDPQEEGKVITDKKEKVNLTKSPDNPYYQATLSITSDYPLIVGGAMDIDLELEMKYIYEGNPYDYERVEYEVVRHGKQFDMNMGYLDCNDIWCSNVLAAQAGEWDIRAYIRYNHPTYGYQFVYSNVVTLEIFYPEVDDIKVDPTIVSEMETAWNATINAAGPGNLEERGFSILGNTTSGSLVYEVKYGNPNPADCGQLATISVPFVSETEAYHKNGVKFPVAWFHTHPPQKWCSGCRSTLIPSSQDLTTSTNKKLPGILMDYKNRICSNHSLNLESGITTFGPIMRVYDEN